MRAILILVRAPSKLASESIGRFVKGAPEPEWMAKGIPYLEREQEKEKLKADTGVY